MSRLETIDGENWEEFVRSSPAAVLIVGKSDCPSCQAWAQELEQAVADPSVWPGVRFGKVLLDKPGLVSFKRANPWVAKLDALPHTVIYQQGEHTKDFVGGGWTRLENRLRRLLDPEGAAS